MWTRSRRSSPDSRRRQIALVPVALALIITAAGAARTDESPSQREDAPGTAREILSNDDYQTELPPTLGTPHESNEGWLSVLAPLGGLTGFLLSALAAVSVLLLVLWLARTFLIDAAARRKRGPDTLADVSAVTHQDLPDPSRMAEQGLYRQAIHALLLLAIRNIARRESIVPARSWTSRELARRLPMNDRDRRSFALLVTTVEVSHFGDVEIGQDDYRTCLGHYRIATGKAAE